MTPNQIRESAGKIQESPQRQFTTEPAEESSLKQKQKKSPEAYTKSKKALKPREYLLSIQYGKSDLSQNPSSLNHNAKLDSNGNILTEESDQAERIKLNVNWLQSG